MPKYAISDIHGCLKTFRELLYENLKFTYNDTLYLLGDYINKGPDSKGVLDEIIKLVEQGHKVFCLRGNHEQQLLDAQLINTHPIWNNHQQNIATLDSFQTVSVKNIPKKYIKFLHAMPYYIALDRIMLVHAGFYFGIKDPFLDLVSMLNIKNFTVMKEEIDNKTLIHGHNPTSLQSIQASIIHHHPSINIDAGCVYYKNIEFGNLVALDLETMNLYSQQNIDLPYPVNIKD